MADIVTMARDGRILMALVDEETGQLDQIGSLVWPDEFGLHEAAVLSTNLKGFLQLNGAAKRKAKAAKRAALPPDDMPRLFHEPDADAIAALPPAKAKAKGKGAPRRGEGRGRPVTTGKSRPSRIPANWPTLTVDGLVEIINGFPDGCTVRDIAQVYSKQEEPPPWARATAMNRINSAREMEKRGVPLPFRREMVKVQTKSGTTIERLTLFPLAPTS
jgi:hypothetical protein